MPDAIAEPEPGADPEGRADRSGPADPARLPAQPDRAGAAGPAGRGPSKADLEHLVQASQAQNPAAEGGPARSRDRADGPDHPADRTDRPASPAQPGAAAAGGGRPSDPGRTEPDPVLLGWLSQAGAPPAMAGRIAAHLGPASADELRENPWLILEVPGIGPTAADAVARAVLGPDRQDDDPRRTRALAGWLLRRAAHRGSTALGADVLARELAQLAVADPAGAIADAIETGQMHAFAEPVALDRHSGRDEEEEFEELDDADDDDPAAMLTSARTVLSLERWTFVEQAAAEVVQRLFATPEPVEPEDDADLDPPLVAAVAENGLTLGPGVDAAGLLTVLAAFPDALVASPSPAGLRTLHEAGIAAVDTRALAADDYAALAEVRVLLIADAQLLSLESGTALFEATAEGTHVLLAGDPVSLRSPEPGALFRDLLEINEPEFGGQLPRHVVKRRPRGPLSSLIEAVRFGGLPPRELLQGEDGTSKDVVIVTVKDPQEAVGRTLQLVTDSIPRTFGFEAEQIQVVAPRADGPVGTITLNAALKTRLNPGPGRCAGFDAGDRVVVTGPVVELGLHGGETGVVAEADDGGLTVQLAPPHQVRRPVVARVEGGLGEDGGGDERAGIGGLGSDSATGVDADAGADAVNAVTGAADAVGAAGTGAARLDAPAEAKEAETRVRIEAADAAEQLRHAWALTAREAQAGRWPGVVAVFDGGTVADLSRALVLGTVSLATEHLSVVHGAGGMLAKAVETIPDHPRRTRLQFALRD